MSDQPPRPGKRKRPPTHDEQSRNMSPPATDASLAAGRWRPVPETPPSLVHGLTHWHWTVALVPAFIAAIAAPAIMLQVAPRAVPLTLSAVVVLLVEVWLNGVHAWRREIDAGYTTTETVFGSPYSLATRYGRLRLVSQYNPAARIGWDDRGLWHLHPRTGQVETEPVRSAQAPGWYPSPTYEGRW